ncbi:MAG: LysR family transcriptional regulator [Clostridiales bacterium]|nr:LysR family transcriptional regulator [Candidatus Crickella merdequi]
MNISQIKYAVKVYELNSFTEAANALFISQPRLSQAINSLEKELGFEIFERNRRGMKGPTTRGYEFLRQSIKTLEEYSQLQKWIPSHKHKLSVSSTINTQSQDAYEKIFVENLIYENMDLEYWITSCDDVCARVKSLESDIGVVQMLGPQYDDWMAFFQLSGLEYYNLKTTRFYATVSKDAPMASMKEVSLDDLKSALFITEKSYRMNELTYEVYEFLDSICRDTRATVANTDIMYHLVAAAPERNAFVLDVIAPSRKNLDKYGLVAVPLKRDYPIYFGYVKRKGEELSPLAKRYIELLTKELED